MSKLLDKALAPHVLNHAWRFYAKSRGIWSENVRMESARVNSVFHLLTLRAQVLDKSYRAEPMQCFLIPKADNKERLICASPVRDKLLQRALLSVLSPLCEKRFKRGSFGFRPQCTREIGHGQRA